METLAPTKRACLATNRAGKPCRSTAIMEDGYCVAHSSVVAADRRFGSPEQARAAAAVAGENRRPYPKLREIVERRIEEKAEKIIGTALESLDATALIVDKDGGEHVHADHFTRLRAADTLMQRGLGRPSSETTVHADVQSVAVNIDATDPAARSALAELLRGRPAKPAV